MLRLVSLDSIIVISKWFIIHFHHRNFPFVLCSHHTLYTQQQFSYLFETLAVFAQLDLIVKTNLKPHLA